MGNLTRSRSGCYRQGVRAMSRRWLGIRVDLIGGRGQILDPPPGRSFAVPPSCTFDDFGRAIDLAFAVGPVSPSGIHACGRHARR